MQITATFTCIYPRRMHLLPLNRCLNDVIKESMSTSKLKLNPDKTEFIISDSKRQRDKLKACFPIEILGSPLCPVDSVKNLGVVRFRFFVV